MTTAEKKQKRSEERLLFLLTRLTLEKEQEYLALKRATDAQLKKYFEIWGNA